MAALAGKVCIVCKKDCSNLPRVKDPQGNYCCKACNDALLKKKVAAPAQARPLPPEPMPVFDDGALDLAALAGQVGQAPPPEVKTPCPGCGAAMSASDVICSACGLNIMTGKKGKSKCDVVVTGAEKSRGSGTAGKVAGALIVANPAAWALGGILAGGAGAAGCAYIMKESHKDYPIMAVGIGLLTGIGVVLVARQRAGVLSGALALFIAFAAMCGGRYYGLSMYVDELLDKAGVPAEVEPLDLAMMSLADELDEAAQEMGKPFTWPPGKSAFKARRTSDYPRDLWQATQAAWNKMPLSERDKRVADAAADDAQLSKEKGDVVAKGFWISLGMFGILYLFVGAGLAYTVGSGGQSFW